MKELIASNLVFEFKNTFLYVKICLKIEFPSWEHWSMIIFALVLRYQHIEKIELIMYVFYASKSDGETISQQTTHCGVIKWIDLECQIWDFPKINCKLMKKYSKVSGFHSVKTGFICVTVIGSSGFFYVEENQPIKSKVNQMYSLLFFNINIFINGLMNKTPILWYPTVCARVPIVHIIFKTAVFLLITRSAWFLNRPTIPYGLLSCGLWGGKLLNSFSHTKCI